MVLNWKYQLVSTYRVGVLRTLPDYCFFDWLFACYWGFLPTQSLVPFMLISTGHYRLS